MAGARLQPSDFLARIPGPNGEHRFENFTDDLLLWVIYYRPERGEGATG